MKIYIIVLLTIFASTLLAASCKKTETVLTDLQKLPPATQTGANTFGCLVNGKAWVAQRNDCNVFCDPSFKVYYENSYGGFISLNAKKIDIQNNIDEEFGIAFDSSNFKLIHPIRVFNNYTVGTFRNYSSSSSCNTYVRYFDSTVTHFGSVNLTKYDLANRIISGTFEFTLTKPGCETISVTEGRFDKKL